MALFRRHIRNEALSRRCTLQKGCFLQKKKIYDDNDDDDVDDDVDYEAITASLIHNLSIVFLSKLGQIEMYIKKPADF